MASERWPGTSQDRAGLLRQGAPQLASHWTSVAAWRAMFATVRGQCSESSAQAGGCVDAEERARDAETPRVNCGVTRLTAG